MATSQTWRLKRYGRFVPGSGGTKGGTWKVFEAKGNKSEIVLTIVGSGYLLVLQGQKSLDTIPLHCASDFLNVHQNSDNLMFQFTVKEKGRMIKMQFDGSTRAEAIKACSSAVEKLKEYMLVTTQDGALPPPNQSPAEVSEKGRMRKMQFDGSTRVEAIKECSSAVEKLLDMLDTMEDTLLSPNQSLAEVSVQRKAVEAKPEVVQGSLSIKRLTQHFLGETAVIVPQVYRHASLAQGDLEPFLRICLLDPSFHTFVEKVEGELRKLLE
ncbi:meiotic recombination protein REC114 [Symphorus nematophorus]